MTIGTKIRYHRKALGLTQTEFGERLGVKKNAVSKWECGRVEDIPGSKVKQIAELFSVPLSYLIDDSIDDSPAPQPSEAELDEKLVKILTQLKPDEVSRVLDFISGMIAARKD